MKKGALMRHLFLLIKRLIKSLQAGSSQWFMDIKNLLFNVDVHIE